MKVGEMKVLEQLVWELGWDAEDIREALESLGKRPSSVRGRSVYPPELVKDIRAYLNSGDRTRNIGQVCTLLDCGSNEVWDALRHLQKGPLPSPNGPRFGGELIAEIGEAITQMKVQKEDPPRRAGKTSAEVCSLLGIDALRLAGLHHFGGVPKPADHVGYTSTQIEQLRSALAVVTHT